MSILKGTLSFLLVFIVSFSILFSVFVFSFFGADNIFTVDNEYVTRIDLSSLELSTFERDGVALQRIAGYPLQVGDKLMLVTYFTGRLYSYSTKVSELPLFCVVNDISDLYSNIDDYREALANGEISRVRVGKTNFYRGFLLPNSFAYLGDTNLSDTDFLPHNYYEKYGVFPNYYEIQTLSIDGYILFQNGVPYTFSYSLPEYESIHFNIYLGFYYWFNGSLFMLDYFSYDFELPKFDYDIDSFGDVFGLVKYLFTYIDSLFDSFKSLFSVFTYNFLPIKYLLM